MSIETIEKSIRKLPPKKLAALLEGAIRDWPRSNRKKLFFFLHVEEIHRTEKDLDPCPLCRPDKEPNAETRKVLEESQQLRILEDQIKNAKNEKERTTLQKKLDAMEKKLGIVRYDNFEDFCRDMGIPMRKKKMESTSK